MQSDKDLAKRRMQEAYNKSHSGSEQITNEDNLGRNFNTTENKDGMIKEDSNRRLIPNDDDIYCKFCDSPINPTNVKTKDRENVQSKFKKPLIAVSIVFSLVILSMLLILTNQLNSLNSELTNYKNKNTDLSTQISSRNNQVSNLETQINNLEASNSSLSSEKYSMQYKVDFLEKNIAIVIEGDKKKVYHSYGCSQIPSTYKFWAYNINAAEDKGYKPCPYCH